MMTRHDMTAEVRAALAIGDVTAAKAMCRAWRTEEPSSVEACNLSGITALHAGEIQDALQFFTWATELAPGDARGWSNLGIAGRQAGREAKWIAACFQQAFVLAPGNPDICYNLALAQHEQGENRGVLATLEAWPVVIPMSENGGWLKASTLHALGLIREARDHVEIMTGLYPLRHEFWRALGDLSLEMDDAVQAEVSYRQALLVAADDMESLRGLGNLLVKQGRPDEGRPLLRRVFDRMGDKVDAHIDYAQALAASGIFIDARQVLQAALTIWPDSAELHFNLGLIHGECGDKQFAEEAVREALELDPNLYLARNYWGILLEKRGQAAEAEACYRQVILQAPDFAEAYNNLANLLMGRLELKPAEELYRRAIELKTDFAEAHHNLGLLLLLTERYEEGWSGYRWRWNTPDGKPHVRAFDRPEWQGQDLVGKRLLVHAEQGFGDTIQFVRYMSKLAQSGATVIFESPPALVRVLQGVPGIDMLFKRGEPIPEYDWHVPLLNIPGLVGTCAHSILSSIPYLVAERELVSKWSERLAVCDPTKYRVGIVWAGNPKHAKDRERSISPNELQQLSNVGNVHWINLYKAPKGAVRQSAAPLSMIDWTEDLTDYADTAALIAGLDLVISVDTSVAHLAGALGKPVWILLPYVPDWRWMLERRTSAWYPSATLYRQTLPGGWNSVLSNVAQDLRSMGEKKRPAKGAFL
jgi:tetratricopeptide (TPR) repeat protein